MSDFLKGVIVMAGFIGSALSSLFREQETLVENAKAIGGIAACRIHRREHVTDMATGEGRFVWRIEFKTAEDAEVFDTAIRSIVDSVTEEAR